VTGQDGVEPALRRILNGLCKLYPAWEQHPLPLGMVPQILDYPEETHRVDGGFHRRAT
jgi:hypothetical protein